MTRNFAATIGAVAALTCRAGGRGRLHGSGLGDLTNSRRLRPRQVAWLRATGILQGTCKIPQPQPLPCGRGSATGAACLQAGYRAASARERSPDAHFPKFG
jgi:hypothetical protein